MDNDKKIREAIIILRDELLLRETTYSAFVASIAAALKEHGYCGLPFEPEEEMARKVLDFIIGEE